MFKIIFCGLLFVQLAPVPCLAGSSHRMKRTDAQEARRRRTALPQRAADGDGWR
jgi:hypothetical protein